MANLVPQSTAVVGTTLTTYTPTATVGDTVPINSRVLVRNGSGAGINVTVVTPGNDSYGLARPDIVTAVGAGAMAMFGPFPADLGDPAASYAVTVICSATATVTLSVMN
jgi:hypothetical protein